MYSIPDADGSNARIFAPGERQAVIGLRVNEVLHRFAVTTHAPRQRTPLRAANVIGEPAARFSHRWMFAPDSFLAAPGREPPPTPLAPDRPQRFIMLDGLCTFGDAGDGFRGFGTGQTQPAMWNGRTQLLATAIRVVTEGFGKFQAIREGTYVYCGVLSPDRGFTGNVLLRAADPQGILRVDKDFRVLDARSNPEPDTTYILVRGQAVPSDRVGQEEEVGAGGRPSGLTVEQGLRLLDLDFKAAGRTGLESTDRFGPFIGRITAHVAFDPTAPGGTIYDPIPFTSYDEFVFRDEQGDEAGGFTATSSEGRVFHTEIAGQPGIRFGGSGRLLSGTGPFEGISGLMTDNSVVMFTPHVSASVYVLRVQDQSGKFSAAPGDVECRSKVG
jgi:hypothetical protein